MAGVGHSNGSHSTNYRSTDASWMLKGAGYRGVDPEVHSAWVKALYQVRLSPPWSVPASPHARLQHRSPPASLASPV
eukprot:3029282-Prymnesium_polylepis.1